MRRDRAVDQHSPKPSRPRLLLVDNYDSFTFNLAQALAVAGAAVEVVRNDALSVPEVLRQGLSGLVISPGPGQPSQAGKSPALLAAVLAERPDWPILGVCLGHQMLAEGFGARVERASRPIHGKIWQIRLAPPPPNPTDDDPLWRGLPPLLGATRYHSLVVAPASLPPCLRVSAWSAATPDEPADEPVIMALHHVERPLFGLQFHPESIGCPLGPRLLENFVALCRQSDDERRE
ncbi:aminodeoxychorismate/anthranilate synthase component II [Haliangium sp. UPWRP_2]|uniref:anthranilate synthase component II n=1 Tax=Haliangium sp. UPWRP_2 TaxID=1931276 RepID=UPI001E47F8BB|nr:aminodeoxychorismate/anthranilate synthase component II [Haliangium sp. UPWRP_2]